MVCDLSKNNLKENLENYVNLLIEGQLLNEEKFNYKDIIDTIQKKVAGAKNDVQQSLGIAYHVPQIIFDSIRNNPEFSEKELVKKGYDSTQLLKDITALEDAEDKMAAIATLLGIENTSIEEIEKVVAQQATNQDKIYFKVEGSEELAVDNILSVDYVNFVAVLSNIRTESALRECLDELVSDGYVLNEQEKTLWNNTITSLYFSDLATIK